MDILGVIFDFDGTIYDSMVFWKSAASNYLKTLNIIDDLIDEESKVLTIKESCELMSKRHNILVCEKDILDYFFDAYPNLLGINRVIERIKEYHLENKKMIIATVTTKSLVEKSLKNLGLYDYFIDIITVDDVKKSKNYPDIYDKCLEILNLKKENVLVYEDSIYAIKTLIDNNYQVIGVKGSEDLSAYINKIIEVI